jgi:hypothetical protein
MNCPGSVAVTADASHDEDSWLGFTEMAEGHLEKKLEQQQADCEHAWVLNVKPAVCLYCGARKKPRASKHR